MRYDIFGEVIESDTQLRCLEARRCLEETCTPLVRIRRARTAQIERGPDWEPKILPQPGQKDEFWSLHCRGSCYLLEHQGQVQFIVNAQSAEVIYSVCRGSLSEYFEWTLLHLAIPLALHLNQVPVYHAAAVSLGSDSIAFVAHSGNGKSTLTAAFGRAGYPVITDDVLAVKGRNGRYYATPSFPWVRLCRDSARALFGYGALRTVPEDGDGKLKVDSDVGLLPFATKPVPIRGVYILSRLQPPIKYGNIAEVSPLEPAEAVGLILSHDVSLPMLERSQLSRLLASLNQMTEVVPVWRLGLAPGLETISETVSAILRHQDDQDGSGVFPVVTEMRHSKA